MKQEIAIRKKRSITFNKHDKLVGDNTTQTLSLTAHVMSLNAEMMSLGYVMSNNLYDTLTDTSIETIISVYNESIPVLRKLKGADVQYTPMYTNFPTQVMDMSDTEFYLNALLHYWTGGEWNPKYATNDRKVSFENIDYITIDYVNDEAFQIT